MTEQIDDRSGPWLNAGTPRDAKAAAALARYDARAPIPLVLSAVLPLVVAPVPGNPVSVVIGVLSWAVFVVDFAVHERLLRRYLSTRLGKFDLAIVLLTAPWFLLPGAVPGGGVIVLLRLARLARLVVASKRARQLFDRIGRVAIVAVSVMTAGAVVAYYAEHPVNPEFATFGDSLWWAIVTLTTVGYGDIVPETTTGRIAAIMIMLTGVAVLGLLAGTLASFFRLRPSPAAQATDSATVATATPDTLETGPTSPDKLDRVLTELTELRAQVAELTDLKTQLAVLTARHEPTTIQHASENTVGRTGD
jgi:voltage-gated potassium channel